jgi:signal transduction histidine kinase
VKSPIPLQDSGPGEHRLLARLLGAGTLVLDERDVPCFASAAACALFGADDEGELRDTWSSLAVQLRAGDWPRALRDGEAFHARADIVTARGPRSIRYELHAVDAARGYRALLVRDRVALSAGDGPLVLASEAEANRHVLTGLVHAAKGPLNNFNLTLSLLASSLARTDAPGAKTSAKRARYVDVLQSEAARLAACIEEINALTPAPAPVPSREPIDVGAMSHECARVLRHGATMREVSIDVDVPAQPVNATGDPRLVRLALLSLAISVIELTAPGGRIGWQVTLAHPRGPARIVLSTSQARLPQALVATLFRLSCIAGSAHTAAIAARVIVEAQGGELVVRDGRDGEASLAIVLPAHA